MARSTVWPMVACRARALRCGQRASDGTQKMFSAMYSSRSSAASSPHSASTAAWCSSKASEMYFRKMSPSTTCLYSAASIEPRRASAIAHSSASWPVVAPLSVGLVAIFVAVFIPTAPGRIPGAGSQRRYDTCHATVHLVEAGCSSQNALRPTADEALGEQPGVCGDPWSGSIPRAPPPPPPARPPPRPPAAGAATPRRETR